MRGVNVLFRVTTRTGVPRILPVFLPVCHFVPVRTKEAKIKIYKNETKGV
jgi:hypothetical protein